MIFTSTFTRHPALLHMDGSVGLQRSLGEVMGWGEAENRLCPWEREGRLRLESHHWAAHLTGTWALCSNVWGSDGGGWNGALLHSQGG